MKKNKGLKITIIILAILIILSVIAFALIYVFTDLFKSNKELFAKYAVSMMQEKTAFLPSNLKEYINKKSTTPYENNGSLTANISSNSNEQINNMFNFANNARINFSGKVDAANNRDEQNINIFYTNDVSLPFNYKHVEDIYALQADFALPNYVGIENNNIPELLQKLGVNIDSSVEIPNKIEGQDLETIKFSDEEMKGLYNNYFMPAINNLTDDKFSKMENSDGSVDYAITLTVEDLKNILIQMLQNLSQDTSLISKINSIYQEISNGTETIITADDVNDMISNLQETKVNDGDLTVTITQFNGKVNKVDITIISSSESNSNSVDSSIEETEANFTIIKEETSSNLTYDISLNMLSGETEITGGLEMSYTNINTSSVVENYAITVNVNDMTNLKYSFSNNVVFANSVGIADFDLNNTIVLNNYQTADIQTFLNQLGTIITNKNEEQMKKIGYPTELINPIYMWIAGPALNLYIYNMTSNITSSANLNDQAVAAYNQQFLNYEGTRTGTQVRTLVNLVSSHNASNAQEPSKQIQITSEKYEQGQTLAAPTTQIGEITPPALMSGKTYNVTFAYDPTTGYITACGITEEGNINNGNSSSNSIVEVNALN